jgi:transcriptional regulator with XRE-family HTH domain
MQKTPNIMSKFEIPMQIAQGLIQLGQRIRIARIRRRWSVTDLANKADINRNTLTGLELGKPGTAVGVYFTILWALGLDKIQLPDTLETVPAALLRVQHYPMAA